MNNGSNNNTIEKTNASAPLGFSLEDVDDRVVNAVANSSNNSTSRSNSAKRVSVADVAAASGLQISTAQTELVKLASLTSATLEVSADGEVLYEFPRNVRSALSAASRSRRARELFNKIAPVLSYIARVSFGITLIASIAIVFTAIAVLASSSRDSDNNDGRSSRTASSSGSSGGGMIFYNNNIFGPTWYDMLWYDPYYSYRRTAAVARGERSMGFLEAVFSFVFGDRDNSPSELDEQRWRAVAALIRANQGAVVAEQLRPLLDPSGEDQTVANSDTIVSERFVLPALTRFGGHPEVTNDGELIYVFPQLQKTADVNNQVKQKTNNSNKRDNDGNVFQENKRRFSLASGGQRIAAGVLGVVNFLGVVKLGMLLGEVRAVGVSAELREFVGVLGGLFPALAVYAVMFLVIPAVRAVWVRKVNAGVVERNEWRREGLERLKRDDGVRRKVQSAKKFRVGETVFRKEDAVYRSDQGVRSSGEFSEFSDFDERLSNRNFV
mmetsp:Transcript_5498/g.11590  ORF Transcript_5498/g.11590 Transcript_5498/m.11590 type:complete len:496 (+) Transcript_5498:171-1658(+)